MPENLKIISKKWQARRDVHTKSYQNPFFKEKKSIIERVPWNFLNGILFVFIAIFGFYIAFVSPWFGIRAIDLSEMDGALIPEIHSLLVERFNDKLWGVFSRDNVFLYDLEQARRSLSGVIGGDEVDVFINKGVLRAVVHQGNGVIRFSSDAYGTYSVNKNGVVLKKIQEELPPILFNGNGDVSTSFILDFHRKEPLIRSTHERPIKIGQKIIDESLLFLILYLDKKLIEDFFIKVDSYLVEDDYSRHVRVETVHGWILYFAMPDSPKELERVLKRLKLVISDKFGGRYDLINSIDLRYGEKVFYY